jgi:chorismate mutase/prephenate dehydratase
MSDETTQEAAARIAELRSSIDAVDCQIVKLLNERADLALAIRDLKPTVRWSLYDPKREEEIFSNLAKCNEGPLYGDNLKEIYEAILHVMKELRA